MNEIFILLQKAQQKAEILEARHKAAEEFIEELANGGECIDVQVWKEDRRVRFDLPPLS